MPSAELSEASLTQLREIAVASVCALLATWLLAKLLTQYARGLWRIVVFVWRVCNIVWFVGWLWTLAQRSPQAQLMAQRMLVGGGPLALSIWQQCFPASRSAPPAPTSPHSPWEAEPGRGSAAHGPGASCSSRAATSAPASSSHPDPPQQAQQADALSRLSQVLRRFV